MKCHGMSCCYIHTQACYVLVSSSETGTVNLQPQIHVIHFLDLKPSTGIYHTLVDIILIHTIDIYIDTYLHRSTKTRFKIVYRIMIVWSHAMIWSAQSSDESYVWAPKRAIHNYFLRNLFWGFRIYIYILISSASTSTRSTIKPWKRLKILTCRLWATNSEHACAHAMLY